MQSLAKQDELEDQERNKWISLSALMLIGLLNCEGTQTEKAQVFLRIVQPEYTRQILVIDREVHLAVFFLTNLATVLLYMQKKVARDGRECD